jgi:hypothetical protein
MESVPTPIGASRYGSAADPLRTPVIVPSRYVGASIRPDVSAADIFTGSLQECRAGHGVGPTSSAGCLGTIAPVGRFDLKSLHPATRSFP